MNYRNIEMIWDEEQSDGTFPLVELSSLKVVKVEGEYYKGRINEVKEWRVFNELWVTSTAVFKGWNIEKEWLAA